MGRVMTDPRVSTWEAGPEGARLLGEAIYRTHHEQSISSLFV